MNPIRKFSRGRVIVGLITLSGYLSLTASRQLGKILGRLLWLLPNRLRSNTRKNLARCLPHLSDHQRERLVLASLQHTATLPFEMAVLWRRSYPWLQKHIVDVSNASLFHRARQEQSGLIVLLPHYGNWEIFSRYIPAYCPVVGLYDPARIPELAEWLRRNRESTGATMVPTNTRGVAHLLRHLRKGGTTCILPDQVPSDKLHSSVKAPFFDHWAHTMTLVTQLHQRTGCTVIGATARRVERGFSVCFWPVNDAVYEADKVKSATAINQMVQTCVQEAPEQYQWEYRRFR